MYAAMSIYTLLLTNNGNFFSMLSSGSCTKYTKKGYAHKNASIGLAVNIFSFFLNSTSNRVQRAIIPAAGMSQPKI